MIDDAKALAAKLGVPFEGRKGPHGTDSAVEVTFFKPSDEDPAHTRVTRDGQRVPLGVPVAELRKRLAKTDGAFVGPSGRAQVVTIPAEIHDGDGYYAAISYKRRS